MVLSEQITEIYKLGSREPHEHSWISEKVFAREVRKGVTNLCIGASGSSIRLLNSLLEVMHEPLWLLYVLVVSRGEGEQGRYQSVEPITREAARTFLNRFQNYLEADGRCNVWLKSVDSSQLLVSDRHDLIYAYGPIDQWVEILRMEGWKEVDRDSIQLPDPHSHHYHTIFDDDALRVLSSMDWTHSPLREQDQ